MQAVLFDLDGTLIDTGALYAECYRRAFAAQLPEPPNMEEMARRRPASERHFVLEWFGADVGDRIHRSMCEAYEELAGELLGGFFEGVPEMLDALSARGVPMAVVTGKSRRSFEATSRHLALDRWRFEAIVLEDDVPAPKPDPAGLVRALEVLGVPSERSIYVGDTPMDLEAARRASMIGASALWRYTDEERTRFAAKMDPEFWVLSSPRELAARFR
jgi:pyrophosphatase PpaX